MVDITVVGIGNPYRGDDAIGWAVIDELSAKIGTGVKLTKQRGDIAELIDIFAYYKIVYLIDACYSGEAIGSWQRIDVLKEQIKEENPQTSTHGFSVCQAIAIAKNLHQLPSKMILYAIYGDRYSMGDEMSLSVVKNIDLVVKAILNEKDIQSCTNTV